LPEARRLVVFLDIELYTKFHCAIQPHSLLALLTLPGSGSVILVATIDRLLTVIFPFAYPRINKFYALALMALGYAAPMPTLLLTVSGTDREVKDVSFNNFDVMVNDVFAELCQCNKNVARKFVPSSTLFMA
jgi:hypothetical protein